MPSRSTIFRQQLKAQLKSILWLGLGSKPTTIHQNISLLSFRERMALWRNSILDYQKQVTINLTIICQRTHFSFFFPLYFGFSIVLVKVQLFDFDTVKFVDCELMFINFFL